VSNFVSCVSIFFLILVLNELFNTKYGELTFFNFVDKNLKLLHTCSGYVHL